MNWVRRAIAGVYECMYDYCFGLSIRMVSWENGFGGDRGWREVIGWISVTNRIMITIFKSMIVSYVGQP